MSKQLHVKWVVGGLLFLITISPAFTREFLYNAQRSMDNTIYQYSDINGNSSFFYISPAGHCIMEYDSPNPAVQEGESMPNCQTFLIAITMADYNYLVQLFKVAISESAGCKKGTHGMFSMIGVIDTKQKNYTVDCSSGNGRIVDSLVSRYKTQYQTGSNRVRSTECLVSVNGTIAENFYESKKGVRTDIMEYFFRPSGEEIIKQRLISEYFIKLWEGNILKTQIRALVGKQVTISAYIKKGLWDATDEQHASRFGYYVAIMNIRVH